MISSRNIKSESNPDDSEHATEAYADGVTVCPLCQLCEKVSGGQGFNSCASEHCPMIGEA